MMTSGHVSCLVRVVVRTLWCMMAVLLGLDVKYLVHSDFKMQIKAEVYARTSGDEPLQSLFVARERRRWEEQQQPE